MNMKKWKLYCFLCCAVLYGSSLPAQEAFNAVKIYGDFYIGKMGRGEPNLYLGRFDTNNFKGGTIAYLWVNPEKKYSKELELGMRIRTRNISFDSVDYAIKDFEAAARFELGVRLKKKLFNYLTFSLNPALDLYFYQGDAQPMQSTAFPVTNIDGGILFSFIPHLEIPLGPRLFLDLNVNFINVSFGISYQRNFNPTLNDRQQKTGGFDFDTQGERSFQIGLGYRLFSQKNNLPQE